MKKHIWAASLLGIPIGRTFKLVEALFRRQFGRYRLGDDCGCLGTVDDASRAGFILRRYGAGKNTISDDDAQLFHRDIGRHRVAVGYSLAFTPGNTFIGGLVMYF